MAKNLGTINTHPVERRVGKDIAAMYKRRSDATNEQPHILFLCIL